MREFSFTEGERQLMNHFMVKSSRAVEAPSAACPMQESWAKITLTFPKEDRDGSEESG